MARDNIMQVCLPDVTRVTAAYHQTILGLAEGTSNEVGWSVSQNVLDRRWDQDCTTAADVSNQKASTSSTDASFEAAQDIIVHVCQRCGFHLHPEWRGSSLRIQRLASLYSTSTKRTLRRREQRKRRKAVRIEEMRAKDYKWNRHPVLASDGSTTRNGHVLTVLRDDPTIGRFDRNRLVLTCGKCQDKTYLKGLRRESKGSQVNTTKSSSQRSAAIQQKRGNFGENFEPLPKYQRNAPLNPTSTQANKSSPPASLIEQKIGRKKKKKNTTSISNNQRSGNLLNFLSSLNEN